MAEEEHQFDLNLVAHNEVGNTTEGGACLNRHGGLKEGKPTRPKIQVHKSSCDHRFQARSRAQTDDQSWYNYPAYQKLCKRTWVPVDKMTVHRKPYAQRVHGRRVIRAPDPGDWDVRGDNFMMFAKDPYSHEAHHIIPDSVFNSCVRQLADRMKEKSERAYRLVRKSLLKAEYNLNHKENMVILPQDELIAIVLALPRHTEWPEDKFHAPYSATVKTHVKKVISSYMDAVGDELKKCRPAPVKLAKAQLERVSRAVRGTIRDLGMKKKAHLLSRITDEMIRKKLAVTP